MSWLRRDRSGDYARELAELDRSARAATREARGHLLNRCGDLCAANNDKGEALRYYGDAGRSSYMKIAEANGLADANKIKVGQKLKIPGTTKGPDAVLA